MDTRSTPLVFCPTCRRELDGDRLTCPTDGDILHPVPRDAPRPGSVLDGRLLVVDRIGTGGMGTIFRAIDLTTREDLALKVLKAQLAQDESAVQQFYHEARAAKRLRHPNIVSVEGYGRSNEGHLYIAMELLGGFPLATLLADREPVAPPLAVHFARQVCAALEVAHAKGTVHRDLKPENIQVTDPACDEPTVKVLDFGIASVLAVDMLDPEPSDQVSGTPAYMSPEQIMGRPVDPRSDLYGLGVLLFEMLCGWTPFDGETAVDICRKHLAEDPPELAAQLPRGALPGGLTKLVGEMLRKNPSRRPTNARAVLNRLDAVAEMVGPPRPVFDDFALADASAAPANHRARTAEGGGSARPPLVRDPAGGLRVMPMRGGSAPQLDAPPDMPDESTRTLVNAVPSLPDVIDSLTLRSALWLCPSCSFLNSQPNGDCENCGAEMRGPRTGVPILPEGRPTAEPSLHWNSLADAGERGHVAVPLVSACPEPERAAPTGLAPDAQRTEIALLHVTLAGARADGSALGTETLRYLLDHYLASWKTALALRGGIVSLDTGAGLRALFGMLPQRPERWLERAVDAAIHLRELVARAARELDLPLYIRGALAAGSAYLEPDALADADAAVRGSPVDVATRLVRNAPAGEVLLNAGCWRKVASAYSGEACDAVRARGARHAELVYRLGDRVTARPVDRRRDPPPLPVEERPFEVAELPVP